MFLKGEMRVSFYQFELGEQQDQTWALSELGKACLGDSRRTARLITMATALADNPADSLPQACGNWAATKAAYRFLSNDEIAPDAILAAHRDRTLERVGQSNLVLAVQDTTVFNFTTHPATQGLGPIARKFAKSPTGFFVHSCLAVSLEGVPLGLLGQYLWVRTGSKATDGRSCDDSGTAEGKESLRWQAMLDTSSRGLPPATRVITVADREADIYEFFVAADRLQQELLVRAYWNRRLEKQNVGVREAVEQAPVIEHLAVAVNRTDERPARTAALELRVARVTLRAPANRKDLPPVSMSAVLARETSPPDGQEPIEWLLLTTLPVCTPAEAAACVQWYSYRWRIERYHYILKSGCRIEELQLEDIDRLHRAIAVYSVVAWRLLSLTYANRVTPQQSCTGFLTPAEWKTLHCKMNHTATPPDTPPDLRTAVLWIAQLGGFLGRRHDGAPGVKVLWRGLRRLQDMAEIWELMQPGR